MIDASLASGLQDRYVLERELGRGGMATVYLASDLKHKRSVALKVLRPELSVTLGPDRFRREIETAARLQHPHILSVFDSGEVAGDPGAPPRLWFTMPYVRGESLRDRLRREGHLPIEEALRIVAEAGRALDYAHREGFVHRDVKPENLLLTSEGDTLVADFGIARALASTDLGTREHLTETGIVVGTAAYMSPEQATGDRAVDARADQYALAVTCYEMLAGRPPFAGPSAAAIVAERFRTPPPSVRAARPEVTEHVDRTLQRALALEPADRFNSMSDFVRALSGSDAPASAATVTFPAVASRRRVPLVLSGLGLAALLGAGAALLGRRVERPPPPPHPPATAAPGRTAETRLAVLPFENLGDSADAYFADGVADDVRGKLTAVPGLEVIARASSVQYRSTSKPPEQIARELGVRYLLTGTVRWERAGGGGGSRVRVSPELVEMVSGGAPASRWQRPFDASLTDVFQVQADIAGQVAGALGVALGDSVRQELIERPTASLEAYDAFLKGEALTQEFIAPAANAYQQAIKEYERAVALDPGFVAAWAQLSRTRSTYYFNVAPTPALDSGARAAAERARALAPDRPEPYRALGDYMSVVRLDNTASLEAFETGLRFAPADAALLAGAARTEARLGRWEAARARLVRSAALDPRSATTWRRYGLLLMLMRRYGEARTAIGRALALAPTNLDLLEQRAMLGLVEGDTAQATAVLRDPPHGVDPTDLAVYFAWFQDLYWLLNDDQQRRVLAQLPSAFGGDRTTWAIVRAQIYHARGDRALTRAYADTTRLEIDRQIRATPADAQRHVFRGLALAYLDRRQEAIAEGERAVALVPIARDAFIGPYIQHQLVRIYLLTGEPEKALDRLEPLLRVPYQLSPAWLRIDPTFAPLRGNPRFERLVAARVN